MFFKCFGKGVKEPPDKSKSKSSYQLDKEERLREVKRQNMDKEKSKREMVRYFNLELLTRGYFAKVYKAKDINNQNVAIKRINIKNNRFYNAAKNEINALSVLNSKYVVKLRDTFRIGHYIYIVLPYYSSDLFNYIPKLIGKPNKIFKILLGISNGLFEIHSKNFLHGDIKPENIMLTSSGEPIIIDLGLVKPTNVITINNKDTYISGTLTYLPPEIIKNLLYTNKMDIWALGVLMYIMMFNREPFNDYNIEKEELFDNIKYKQQYYPINWKIDNRYIMMYDVDLYNDVVDLNKIMLRKNYLDRPDIQYVIKRIENIIERMEFSKTNMSLKRSHDLIINHLTKFHSY